MRPKRRHLTRAALALTASAFLILTACNQKTGAAELEAAIAEEIEAATEGRMERFSLADGHVGQPNWVWLEPPLSTDTLRSSDMAASISVIDSHKDDRRLHGNGLELRISSGSAAPNQG
ncbi:MAG: hypothetical protein LBH68_08470, partial [Bifidobacteriaceae bacterium]|nr:hypothetical protein [Bifidobacteriaceae bacterium]